MSGYQFEDKASLDNIIELTGIGQSYDGGQNWIIKDFNLIIEDKPAQGQFAVLLGMSGSGKSTILRYISGLQHPTEGQVLVKGKPVDQNTHISMVFQQYSSLPWMTVLDNVGLALQYQGVSKKDRDARAMELIQLVGLDGHEKKYAMYPTLSGGHSTVIFVTHDISEAVYLGDDIYIMKYAPSKIVEHIHIDLPLHRTRDTKRDPHFTQLVHFVEDTMMKVSSEK